MSTLTATNFASKELKQWFEVRGFIYQLLVDFVGRPPRLSFFARYRRLAERHDHFVFTEGGGRLLSFFEGIEDAELRQKCEIETAEYNRLFSGQTPKLSLSEATIRSTEEHIDARRCAAEISNFYAECGIAFNKLYGEHDDHLAIELEFMAVMADRTLCTNELRQSCLKLTDLQLNFLEGHLTKWALKFADDLSAATVSSMYQGLASLLKEFLVKDAEMLRAWRNLLQ